jgi:hypothetical protein
MESWPHVARRPVLQQFGNADEIAATREGDDTSALARPQTLIFARPACASIQPNVPSNRLRQI